MLEAMMCPTAEDYLRLASGLTPPPEAERLLTHLEGCNGCGHVVESLPESDTLVDLVRQAATIELAPPPSMVRLIEQLSRLRPEVPFPRDSRQPEETVLQPPTKSLTTGRYDWLAPPQNAEEMGRLGPYHVLQVIGIGGMGVVFRARDPHLDRIVALKAMSPDLASREGARQRFLREARGMAAIKHEHIVAIYHVGEGRGVPFLAMEYLEGETLSTRLKREGKLPAAEVIRIGREIALGLAAAHKRELIHRDIKPSNIWLEADTDRVKILDFGLVRAAGADSELTQVGAIVGTPAFMSPEQAQGQPVDVRCDLFSLGCVIYLMAAGKPPFRGADAISTLLAVSTYDPPSPIELDATLPPTLSSLSMNLLAKDPGDRPASSLEVAESLERIAQTFPTKLLTRRRWLIPTAVATCVLLSGLTIALPSGAFRLRTNEGTIVLEDLPPNAEVMVDGAAAKVNYGSDGKWIEIQALPGERLLEIKATGFKVISREVTLSTGQRKPIRIHLEPLSSGVVEAANTPTKPVDAWDGWPKDAPRPAIAPFDFSQAKAHQAAWAKHLNVPIEVTNSLGMRFRLIPPGEFTMGSTAAEIDAAKPNLTSRFDAARPDRVTSEGPPCRVVLTKPFYLAIHEVTQRQYERMSGTNPSGFSATGTRNKQVTGRDTTDYPVETISWLAAASFCNLLSKADRLESAYLITAESTTSTSGTGYRLPTGAEWEFACRAGTTTLYWCGDDEATLLNFAWFGPNNASDSPKPVGTRPANPFGLHDVHGNVWEWVNDGWDPVFYQRFLGMIAKNPHSEMAGDGRKVIRGGDFFMSAAECRSACRDCVVAIDSWDDVGFRLALSVEAATKLRQP